MLECLNYRAIINIYNSYDVMSAFLHLIIEMLEYVSAI